MKTEDKYDDHRLYIIKSTAKLILADGNFFPTVTQIAKKASISSASLNYYFDSKEDLMDNFYQYAADVWKSKVDKLFEEKVSLETSINEYIDFSFDMTSRYPFLEFFLSVGKDGTNLIAQIIDPCDMLVCNLYEKLLTAMKEEIIYTMDPVQMIINLLSITDQPFRILSFREADDDEVRSFVEHFRKERKELILRSIFI